MQIQTAIRNAKYHTTRSSFLAVLSSSAKPYSGFGRVRMQVYTIYSILFIVFLILLIVTAFITIALTYFQLAVEDHRWWWRSFMCGGSTGECMSAPPQRASIWHL